MPGCWYTLLITHSSVRILYVTRSAPEQHTTVPRDDACTQYWRRHSPHPWNNQEMGRTIVSLSHFFCSSPALARSQDDRTDSARLAQSAISQWMRRSVGPTRREGSGSMPTLPALSVKPRPLPPGDGRCCSDARTRRPTRGVSRMSFSVDDVESFL